MLKKANQKYCIMFSDLINSMEMALSTISYNFAFLFYGGNKNVCVLTRFFLRNAPWLIYIIGTRHNFKVIKTKTNKNTVHYTAYSYTYIVMPMPIPMDNSHVIECRYKSSFRSKCQKNYRFILFSENFNIAKQHARNIIL